MTEHVTWPNDLWKGQSEWPIFTRKSYHCKYLPYPFKPSLLRAGLLCSTLHRAPVILVPWCTATSRSHNPRHGRWAGDPKLWVVTIVFLQKLRSSSQSPRQVLVDSYNWRRQGIILCNQSGQHLTTMPQSWVHHYIQGWYSCNIHIINIISTWKPPLQIGTPLYSPLHLS